MNFNKVKLHISTSRIDRYLVAANQNNRKAERLYKANLKIAQSFYPLLNTLEVVLRNGINTTLEKYFADPDWIINQQTGFMIHPSLRHLDKRTGKIITNEYLKKEVAKAEKKIKNSGRTVTSGKIIAEQTLGFWTEFFEVYHYKILKGRPIQLFRNLPSGYGRKEISDALYDIRVFRNRVYHNEPIIFKGKLFDLSECEHIHANILNIIDWIDPNLKIWIKDIDGVHVKIKNAKRIK